MLEIFIFLLYLDGKVLFCTVYLINGDNFIRLRDLLQALNVNVVYDTATGNILVDTSKRYMPE